MSENDPKNRRRPLKNLPPERFQPKVLLIWLAIVAAVLALFFLNPGGWSNWRKPVRSARA